MLKKKKKKNEKRFSRGVFWDSRAAVLRHFCGPSLHKLAGLFLIARLASFMRLGYPAGCFFNLAPIYLALKRDRVNLQK